MFLFRLVFLGLFMSSISVSKALWSCNLQCTEKRGKEISDDIGAGKANGLSNNDKECLDGERCALWSTDSFAAEFLNALDLNNPNTRNALPFLLQERSFMKKFARQKESKTREFYNEKLNSKGRRNYDYLVDMVNMKGNLSPCYRNNQASLPAYGSGQQMINVNVR